MTTNIQIGLPEGNAPKKVGTHRGQHTDIFGTSEPLQFTPKKSNSGSNVKNLVEDEANSKNDTADHENSQEKNKPDNTNGSAQTQAPAFQRVRMPPGGHSSGLW